MKKLVKISLIITFLAGFYIIGLGTVITYFIDVDKYIDKSKSIALNSFEFIGNEKIKNYYSKEVFIIKANNIYYELLFYKKNKSDYYFQQLDTHQFKINRNLLIRVNLNELKKHQGTLKDPIPIFNFSFKQKEYIWNRETYRHNVRTYLVYDEILNSKITMPITITIFIIFLFISSILLFLQKKKNYDAVH